MKHKLILVFDARRARFFEAESFKILGLKTEFKKEDFNIEREHPRRKNSRVQTSSPSASAIHILNPHGHGTIKEVEREEFCRIIAHKLKEFFKPPQKTFDELVIIADPKSLGCLRPMIDPHVKAVTVSEIPKDLTHLKEKELEMHVFP